jgi:hypothetical protein
VWCALFILSLQFILTARISLDFTRLIVPSPILFFLRLVTCPPFLSIPPPLSPLLPLTSFTLPFPPLPCPQEDIFDEQEREEAQSWLTTIEGTRSRRMRQDLYNG